MRELVSKRPRFGYRRIAALLRREGWAAGATRVLRLWRREGLNLPIKRRNKRARGTGDQGCSVNRAARKDHVWCWDFVFDCTTSGSPLKWLSIIDEHTRECLALKVSRRITAEDAIDALAELFAMRGCRGRSAVTTARSSWPGAIRKWLAQVGVQSLYIAPGSPWQNGYAENFRSRLRDEFLALEVFESLAAARTLSANWKDDYRCLPHDPCEPREDRAQEGQQRHQAQRLVGR